MRRVLAVVVLLGAPHADGLPTMVRLAYPNCSSCHIAPQGAGLLNRYGRGVDQAQSLRGGEYSPLDSEFSSAGESATIPNFGPDQRLH